MPQDARNGTGVAYRRPAVHTKSVLGAGVRISRRMLGWDMATPSVGRLTYSDRAVARNYEKTRFSSMLGRVVDRLEKRAVVEAVVTQGDANAALEAPCGTARIGLVLASLGAKVVGVDISLEMIRVVKGKLATSQGMTIEFVRSDIERLPFRAAAFDAAVCVRLMNLVSPSLRSKMIEELARVASNCLVVSYLDPSTLKGILRRLQGAVCRETCKLPTTMISDALLDIRGAGFGNLLVKRLFGRIGESCFVVARKSRV